MKSYHNAAVQKNRIPFVLLFFIILGFIIAGRLFYLQVFKHNYYSVLANAQHWVQDSIPATRGTIYATDSLSNTPYPLATNQNLNMVYVDPSEVTNKDKVASFLANVLSMKKQDILESFQNSNVYVPIEHKLTSDQSNKISAANLTGVGLTSESWRYYPNGGLAASILGFVNDENQGSYGIEQEFNKELQGTPGLLKEEASLSGVPIAFGDNVSKAPVNGSDIYLTIDRYIQENVQEQLDAAVKKYNSPAGEAIVMNPKTGAILALANSPTFDPNNYASITDYNIFQNKAIQDTYEPGSVFKVITLSGGLDANKITPTTQYDDTGKVTIDGDTIRNATLKAFGIQNMTFVLEQSLNTGSTWVEQKLGKNSFYNYIKKFGFGNPTGVDLPGEASGVVHSPTEVNDFSYATMSFGQGISVTPLQMIDSFAAVANNGKLMRPYIVSKITTTGGKDVVTKPKEIRQVISEKAAKDMTTMMVGEVNSGNGFQAKIAGYKIAGKTGTAQVPSLGGGYDSGKNIGTFIGFAPAGDPQFVVLAKIDEPQGIPWAEESAAPVVGQILSYLINYYQIPPTEAVSK